MKTNLIPIILASILFASCGKNENPQPLTSEAYELPENHHFLITDLPPEFTTGTPAPVHMPGVKGAPIHPSESNSPGTARVIYRHVGPPQAARPSAGASAPMHNQTEG